MNIIKAIDIIHEYNGKRVLTLPSLEIEKGEIYSIVGPNGSGKTTLLSILSLILRPTKGKIFLNGKDVRYDINSLKSLTMVHQNPYLFNTSVEKNISFGLRTRMIPKKECILRVKSVLSMIDLKGFEKKGARELSGGEIQLVALARALVIEPEVLFLDEPTANLDYKHIGLLEEIIFKINKEKGTTIICTTHNLSQAYRITDNVLTLLNGRLIPNPIHNLFKGSTGVYKNETLFDTGRITICVPATMRDSNNTLLSIDPEDIIVSKVQFTSSARNNFKGVITKISDQGGKIFLEVRSLETFAVIITERSLKELSLTIGTEVYITFKASSVHTFE